MKTYRSIALFCGVLSLGLISTANATCTRPVGTYAGVYNGTWYNNTGAVVQFFAADLTVTISSTGSGSLAEYGKYLTVAGIKRYSNSMTFPSISFSTSVCRGSVITSSGSTFLFSVVDSGNEIQLTDYTNSQALLVGTVVLKKL